MNGAVLDYMHNFYGWANFIHGEVFQLINFLYPGIVNDFFKKILVGGYLLNKDKWREFEAIINGMIWPSGTGRLPTNMSLFWIYGAYANDLNEPEVVLTTALARAAHIIFTTADGKDICIVHASDSVGILITVQDLT